MMAESPRGLASLPVALARRVLLCAVDAPQQKPSNREIGMMQALELMRKPELRLPRPTATIASLQQFARVNKAWRVLASDAAAEIALGRYMVRIRNPTRQAVLELRRELTLRGAYLKTVVFMDVPSADYRSGRPGGAMRDVQWAAAFSYASVVEDLNLEVLKEDDLSYLAAIVRAVAEHSRNLRSVVIHPPHSGYSFCRVPSGESRQELFDALSFAMGKSLRDTGHLGVRRLRVSMRFDTDTAEGTRKYLETVSCLAPNIEILDGYRTSVADVQEKICTEQWVIDLEVWEKLCSTLLHLTEFNWICVPFATRFFEVFGNHLKLKLKTLTISSAMNWIWSSYFPKVDAVTRDALEGGGYGTTATNVQSALHACPNLRALNITWYFPLELEGGPRYERFMFPSNPTMDPEIFDDQFWEEAVRLCPQLTTISFIPAMEQLESNRTVQSFTDRALQAIGNLRWLTFAEIDAVRVSGLGVLNLTVDHQSDTTAPWFLHLQLFGDQSNEVGDFYGVIDEFLTGLIDMDAPLACISQNITTVIENKSEDTSRSSMEDLYSSNWSQFQLDRLKGLLARARAKHPSVQLDILAENCDGWDFSRIAKFVFTTPSVRSPILDLEDLVEIEGIWTQDPFE